jgi:hypothetical protein
MPLEGQIQMTSSKQLTANGGLNKEDTRPRTAGGKSLPNRLPAPARSSAPDKVKKNVTVRNARDALALVQVTAALAIPANLGEETTEAVLDGAHALYLDFATADPIDSVLATQICVLHGMTTDAASRAKWSQTIEQREMESKSAIRGARMVINLTEAYDRRRARKQTVKVGQVKVEAGGQAVVGNVTSAPREGPQAQATLPLQPKIEDPTLPRK